MNIINHHERLYREIDAMRAYLDLVMKVFEGASPEEVDTVRAQMMDRARTIVHILES